MSTVNAIKLVFKVGLSPERALESFLSKSERELNVQPEKFQTEQIKFKIKKRKLDDLDDIIHKEDDKRPKNDYCQHFVDTSQRPHNFIRDAGLGDRFEEYPKLRELIKLKDELIDKTNIPPMYLKKDFDSPDSRLSDLGLEFDVILVEPPLVEYQRSNGVNFDKYMNWDEIKSLDIESVAAQRSFIFLWCGSGDGLDKGRECLKKWGFRRCEDICWIKTNKKNPKHNYNLEQGAIFQRSKEHCLMGIKGTVRRSTDCDFIHANVDIDLIITEEPAYGVPDKPQEIYHIIEHFCLGRRRLHLFGRDSTLRDGWVTIGPQLTTSHFDKDKYKAWYDLPTIPTNPYLERIDMLRPKSPPIKLKQSQLIAQPQQLIYIPGMQPQLQIDNIQNQNNGI